MTDKLSVPRRKVRKDWYVGLHPDPVDRSRPDVHDDLLLEEASKTNAMSRMLFQVSIIYIPITSNFLTSGFVLVSMKAPSHSTT